MSLDDIYKLIHEEQERLNLPYTKDSAYDFFSHFLNKYRFTKIEQFVDLDISSFIKCLYYIKMNRTKSLEECSEVINQLRKFNTFEKFYSCYNS